MDMSAHKATCLATLRKVKDISTFLAEFLQLATLHFVAVAGCKTGVLHVKSFLELVLQRLLRDKLQEKLPCVTWPLRTFALIVFVHSYRAHAYFVSQWRHVIHRARARRKICRRSFGQNENFA